MLFTGFEPSGDDHAAAVIAALLRRRPDARVFAWGGPKMQAAGATLVERTGDSAVMGLPGLKKIQEHRKINVRVEKWFDEHKPAMLVPVDSPAANFPICKMAKARGIKVVHLVAPQIWAWGRWRIGKLRRRTDLVLCLLPFEEPFFGKRRVPARFVGHPLFDHMPDMAYLDGVLTAFPEGRPRLALMPGSRPKELAKSFPMLFQAFKELKAFHPHVTGVFAVTTPAVKDRLEKQAAAMGGMPADLQIVAGQTDAVIRWCDLALVKSGTITLQIARQAKPMVVFYKSSRVLYYLIARWIVTTKFFTLPNVLAHRQVVPELVPHFGDHREIVAEARKLLDHPERMAEQAAELARLGEMYWGRNAAENSAEAIVGVLESVAPRL